MGTCSAFSAVAQPVRIGGSGLRRERLLGIMLGLAAVVVLVVMLAMAAQADALWLLITALLPLAAIALAAYLILRPLLHRR